MRRDVEKKDFRREADDKKTKGKTFTKMLLSLRRNLEREILFAVKAFFRLLSVLETW